MTEILNFRRLLFALWRLLSERGVQLFGSIIIVLLICSFFMIIAGLNPFGYAEVRSIFAIFGLIFGPIIYIWIASNEFTNSSQGITYILLPISIFEKWIINNVIVIGFYYFTFGFIFRLVDYSIVARINKKFTGLPEYSEVLSKLTVLKYNDILFYLPVLLGVLVSIWIFIGVMHFRKNALIYSILTLLGVVAFLIFANFVVAKIIFGELLVFDIRSLIPFSALFVESQEENHRLLLRAPPIVKSIEFIIFIVIIILLSIIYYAKLNEKDL